MERVSEKITFQRAGRTLRGPDREARDGDRASKVFAELDKGTPTREIVKLLSIPPEKVRTLAQEWIACGQFDEGPLAVVHGLKEPPPAPVAAAPITWPTAPAPVEVPDVPSVSAARRSTVTDMIADARRRAGETVAEEKKETPNGQ